MTDVHPEGALVTQILKAIQQARLYRSCLTCDHFDEEAEGCALAGGMRPPARVIAAGCTSYSEVPPF